MRYFNEFDETACAVLRHCYGGVVDGRSIKEVKPGDLQGYERAHFFAGAGLWEVACELAGWVGPIWTGSCPCQGESVAGKRLGAADPRDLWPDFFTLIAACRPPVVVGEQVDAAISSHWLDRAISDMEGAGYAFRAVDIPACAVDAPHKRNRIYWVAVDDATTPGSGRGRLSRPGESEGAIGERSPDQSSGSHDGRAMADASGARSFSASHRALRGEAQGERSRHVELERRDGWDDVADAATWSTPRASDGEKGGPNMGFGAGGTPLPAQMAQVPWATPTTRDWKDSGGMSLAPRKDGASRTDLLPRQMVQQDRFGAEPNGFSAPTEKRGAPNPEFACWLMGWPDALISGALQAIQSFRNSRPKSSSRSKKASRKRAKTCDLFG